MNPIATVKDVSVSSPVTHVDWLKTLQPVADQLVLRGRDSPESNWRTVVLVPFAQLMATARVEWIGHFGHLGLPPRFESSTNWASSIGPYVAAPDDFSGDPAQDWPTAVRLLRAAGMQSRSDALGAALCQAAMELSSVASAQLPALRWAWALSQMAKLPQPGADYATVLAVEARLSQIALVWVGQSRFKSDVLFMNRDSVDAPVQIFALPGLSVQPLDVALSAHWGERYRALPWVCESNHVPAPVQMHACIDPIDEASRCSAQINALLTAHRHVVLVAQDRWLVRRVMATLASTPMACRHTVRDETGWKISTTMAGAQIVAVLRAARRMASCDDMLAALKAAEIDVDALELKLRSLGDDQWRRAWGSVRRQADFEVSTRVEAAIAAIHDLGDSISKARTQSAHALALQHAMQRVAAWQAVPCDAAAFACAAAMGWFDAPDAHQAAMSPTQFGQWVSHVLESGNFQPPDSQIDADAAVLSIVPLAQLLGRRFDACVLAGAGEDTMSSPNPGASWWSSAQREALGLLSLADQHAATTQAFLGACAKNHAHVMWRTQLNGQHRLPSSWVQAWLLDGMHEPAADPRDTRAWPVVASLAPLPDASRVVPKRLSASAYRDLRTCPYRYHALHALGLREAPELDGTPDKRDMGNWLHLALRLFHEGFAVELSDEIERIDACAVQAQRDLMLDEAAFLPFSAAWPRLRDRYLAWLNDPGEVNTTFVRGEWSLTREHAGLDLRGQLDRVDHTIEQSKTFTRVIDYKTDSGQAADGLSKAPEEDVQLAFYAALLATESEAGRVQAGYLHVTDGKDAPAKLHLHPAIEPAADALLGSIAEDFEAMRAGKAMAALGEGAACTHCAARGLCRRDFWAGEVERMDGLTTAATDSLAEVAA